MIRSHATIPFALAVFSGIAMTPSTASAQTCDWCDNGWVEGEIAHQFGLLLGEEFCCGEIGKADCHYSYAVIGRCSDEHDFCGGTQQCGVHALDSVESALEAGSPALLHRAVTRNARSVRLDLDGGTIAVLGCDDALLAVFPAPDWIDRVARWLPPDRPQSDVRGSHGT
jgi:hypothetical protein